MYSCKSQGVCWLLQHVPFVCAGYRLRALLVHEVFDKVLYLTPSARAQFSSGRIFNLVTTDAETLQMLFQNILGVISSPARIIGSMVMLYFQLGPASLVALAVLILMMPLQVTSHPQTISQPFHVQTVHACGPLSS